VEPTLRRIEWASAALTISSGIAPTRPWCARCALLLGANAAAISLLGAGSSGGVLCASTPMAGAAEELQLMLGEGPGVSAVEAGEPILVPDLANPLSLRWPSYRTQAAEFGVGAEFSFPLRAGNVSIGVLDLYQEEPGPLSDEQHDNALAVAAVTTKLVLTTQSSAWDGELALPLDGVAGARSHIHQASGIVAAQADLTADDAMVILRAYSYAHDKTLDAVARAVIERRVRFDA
jgi:hypothetical protein